MVPFEKAVAVSYQLSIVESVICHYAITLSLTIRPQFAIEYLRCSNQQGVGHFGAEFGEKGVD